MAFWNQVQQLGKDVSRKLYLTYGDHFPIEVRQTLAELIEEKFKSHPADMDPNNPDLAQKQYIASIVLELVNTLELKAQTVSQNPEEEILHQKLNDAAQNFRRKYTEDPLKLYKIIRDCLCYEQHLVDLTRMRISMKQHLMLDNSNKNSNSSNIMEKLSQIQQQTKETEHILKCIEDYQDVFVIKVNDMQRLVDRFSSLYSESAAQRNTQELERQFYFHKEALTRDLNQGRSNLNQLSNSFVEKIRATISELSTLQATILDKELTRWKIDQRLLEGGNVNAEGNFLSKRLDVLEGWCQSLAESIWSNRHQLKEIKRLVEPSIPIWSQNRSQFESILSFLKIEVTQLLSTLISSTFIVEMQPPQVIKKQTKFTQIPVVRLLVGRQLNLHMNPPQVKVCVIAEEDVKALLSHKSNTKQLLKGKAIGNFLIDTRTMYFDKKTGQTSAHFLNMRLKGIKRYEKTKEDSVLDNKSCLYFQCQFNLGEPDLDFSIYTLSLPVVAIVHTIQETQAWATVRWDNDFGEPGRIPFQVSQEVSWFRVGEALSEMFEAVNGRGLSEENLRCIGGKAFSDSSFGTHDFLSWSKFCKEPLPELPFTFWEWFYAILKLTRDNFRDPWKDGLVHGFVSRKQAETMLSTSPPGTFLLRFSDSVLGSIAISWTHSDKSVLHLDPFTSKDLTSRSLALVIKDLEHLTFLYPKTPTADAFSKYWTLKCSAGPGVEYLSIYDFSMFASIVVDASPGRAAADPYVTRFAKTTIGGLNGNNNNLITGIDDSSSSPRLDSTPHSPHSMQFDSRFPPNLIGYDDSRPRLDITPGVDNSSTTLPQPQRHAPYNPHSMQFDSRFPPNLTCYSSPQSQDNTVDSSMSDNNLSNYMDYSNGNAEESSLNWIWAMLVLHRRYCCVTICSQHMANDINVGNSIISTSNECHGVLEKNVGNAIFPFDLRGFLHDYLSKQRDESSDE